MALLYGGHFLEIFLNPGDVGPKKAIFLPHFGLSLVIFFWHVFLSGFTAPVPIFPPPEFGFGALFFCSLYLATPFAPPCPYCEPMAAPLCKGISLTRTHPLFDNDLLLFGTIAVPWRTNAHLDPVPSFLSRLKSPFLIPKFRSHRNLSHF